MGYFVNNDYESEELKETPPEIPDISQIHRNVNIVMKVELRLNGPNRKIAKAEQTQSKTLLKA